MWINRIIESRVLHAASMFPAVFLGGARQVGKTSLIRRLWPGARYVSLDLPQYAEIAERSPGRWLADPAPLLVDEVQYAPGFLRHLKAHIDAWQSEGPDATRLRGQFILTGSQGFASIRGASESLAGRLGVLRLDTLAGRELEDAGLGDRTQPLEAVVRGGFPSLWTDPAMDAELWMTSYVATYLERDVRNLLSVQSLRDFERFLRAIAARSAGLLNYADVARDVGISVPTARAWLSTLEATGQIFIVEPYYRSFSKRLAKAPKVYFADTGIAAFLTGVRDARALAASPLLGPLWETWVAGQLRRALEAEGGRRPLWFWRTHSGAEVDFVVEDAGRFHLIEVKASEVPNPRDAKGFRAFAAEYGEDVVASRTVVCRTPIDTVGADNVAFVNGFAVDAPHA